MFLVKLICSLLFFIFKNFVPFTLFELIIIFYFFLYLAHLLHSIRRFKTYCEMIDEIYLPFLFLAFKFFPILENKGGFKPLAVVYTNYRHGRTGFLKGILSLNFFTSKCLFNFFSFFFQWTLAC